MQAQSSASSDGIFFLDWKYLPMDSIIPRYTEVIPLESDYRNYDYRVSLLYPEWKEMTKEEMRKMSRWADSLSFDLRINTFVGVNRGKGVLDVDFIPVVARNGRYYKLMSAKMEINPIETSPTSASFVVDDLLRMKKASGKLAKETASVRERYTRQSRLAEGKWVKISIKEDGMYRLTRSALQKMGFKNPQNVHLYGHGGHRLSEVSKPSEEFDDLQEVPLYQADNDTWLFWGNGLVYWNNATSSAANPTRIFNQYANAACYFLTEEDAPSKIETVESKVDPSATIVSSFEDHVLYEKDEFAYAQTGRNLFENVNFANSGSRTYKLTTPVASLGNERLTIVFTAAAKKKTTVTPTVNGQPLSNLSVSALGSYMAGASVSETFDVAQYASGTDWTVKLSSTSGNDAHLDYLALHYQRAINPGQSFVAFSGRSSRSTTFHVSSFGEGYQVMRIGKPGSPAVLVKGELSNGTCQFTSENGSDRFVCFNPKHSYPQPSVVGSVENQNLHALDSLDMVIIIPGSGRLYRQAERLAEAHRAYDGLRVQVVRADQVYNEFSSGTPDATAYRRLMKMLYDRADGDALNMPRYLLLMGNCTFDNRMLTAAWSRYNPQDYLLCFESENSFSDTQSYVMEDYFGLLDDGEGVSLTREKPDLGVGRFPVTTPEEAEIMVDKVVDFISNSNAGAWKNVVLMLGDDGDNNSHMKYCDDVAERIIADNPELEVKKVMWDAYTRVSTLSTNTYPEVTALIKRQLEEGVMLVNYTGHGAPYVLSHEEVWMTPDYDAFKSRTLPVWFTAACDIMPFDGQTTNQGVKAVLNKGGGALAFVGTTRTVYASNNMRLNTHFSRYIFGTDEFGRRQRLGDALRLAKMNLVDIEYSNLENKLQYAILGDPALVLGAPLNRVKLDAIVDAKSGEKVDVLRAGLGVKLQGHIVDSKGMELTDFDGVVSARIYDSMDTITCKCNDPLTQEAFVFKDRSSVIYAGSDSVRNGQFTISFVVPKDIKYSNAQGRIVLYAINDSLNVEANGYKDDFTVGGSVNTSDEDGPAIEMALNGEIGGTVNSTPYFVARLSDENGINVSGNGIGHDILLSIDNNPEWTYVLNDYYVSDFGDFTHGSVGFVIPSLPAGPHTLSLRAWDLLNNTNLAEMDFNVDLAYEPNILHLATSPNPAVTHTNFLLSYDLPGSECDFMIEVFDFSGHRLWMTEARGTSSTGSVIIPWNLRVGDGFGRISPGVYLYRATISSGESKKVTKTQKLIVN